LDSSKWRGQGYDGASTMSGHVSGVQARITSKLPKAKFFVHCRSHCLNLAIVASCGQVPEIRNFMDTFKSITFFFFASRKRKGILSEKLLESAGNDVLAAVIYQYILAFTRPLSVVLQSKECDLILAHEDARNLVAATQSQRSDEKFHLLYSRATAIASKVGVSPTKPRTVNRQVNRANANVGGDIEVHYKVNFYYPFIDHVIQHLNDRFPEEIKEVLLASFLTPSKLHLLDETAVAKIEQSLGDKLPNKAEFGQE